ncbi:hypothetical protein [Synechococcus sp. 'PEA 65AY6A-5F PE A']|uniref:hypothetical protein n=1 Tax=Synechococcus sp. 'PEA 65AY6A-5F PE A' TaxID=1504259 RepID=UPI0039C0928E
MTDPKPASSPGQSAASATSPTFPPLWLSLALGITTAPVLLGLVLADRAGKWLGSLNWEDPGWWLGERLPNLDSAALCAQQQERKDSGPAENP